MTWQKVCSPWLSEVWQDARGAEDTCWEVLPVPVLSQMPHSLHRAAPACADTPLPLSWPPLQNVSAGADVTKPSASPTASPSKAHPKSPSKAQAAPAPLRADKPQFCCFLLRKVRAPSGSRRFVHQTLRPKGTTRSQTSSCTGKRWLSIPAETPPLLSCGSGPSHRLYLCLC